MLTDRCLIQIFQITELCQNDIEVMEQNIKTLSAEVQVCTGMCLIVSWINLCDNETYYMGLDERKPNFRFLTNLVSNQPAQL